MRFPNKFFIPSTVKVSGDAGGACRAASDFLKKVGFKSNNQS